MINEEEFEGFYVVECPKCGKHQIPFKKDDKIIYCPTCENQLDKKDILKKIKKRINRRVHDNSSVNTSIFNY